MNQEVKDTILTTKL